MTPTIKLTESIISHLHSLERDGRLTPRDVVEDAKHDDSPLHDLFDWNVERAAEKYWLARSRAIIRTARVIVHTEIAIIRAPRYVHDPDLPARVQGYVSVARLRSDEEAARRALIAECGRIASQLERARALALVVKQADILDDLMLQIIGLKAALMTNDTTGERVTASEN